MLTRRALSARELADRLQARGHNPAAVRSEVNRLRQVGLVDDRRLADVVVRSQLQRGRGRRAITLELRRRGLSATVTAAALASLAEEEEQTALEAALARARRRHSGSLKLPPTRQKVLRYLLSRGFSPSQARAAMDEAVRGEEESARENESGFFPDPEE